MKWIVMVIDWFCSGMGEGVEPLWLTIEQVSLNLKDD